MLKQTLTAVVATAIAMGAAVAANAGEYKSDKIIIPNTLGAAVAMPYLTSSEGGDRMTVNSITNTLDNKAVSLHITWISGSDWSSIDYDCPLTPLETTYFIHEKLAGSDNAIVTFECSDNGQDRPKSSATNNIVTRTVHGADGIMFVAHECQLGDRYCDAHDGETVRRTRHENSLAADFVVMDFATGSAFSAPAIHIQGLPNRDFFNRNYDFNGEYGEYRRFPSLLTTNYIAPDDSVTAELLLFTLDGTVGSGGGINAKVAGFAYDDDENPTSGQIEFDCLTVAPINGSPNGFGLNVERPFNGNFVGHLELFPAAVARDDVHEAKSYSNDGVRRALVHGFLVQTVAGGGEIAGREFGGTMAVGGAWARQLTQGTNALVDIGYDNPSLDTKAAVID